TAPFAVIALASLASLAAILAGELHARAGATIRPSNANVVTDVIGALTSGGAEARTPAGAGPRLFPPFLDQQHKWIRGDERRWLYMHPPSDVTLRARIPVRAYLQTALAIDPAAWSQPVGDGVRFLVEANSGAGWVTLLDRHLHPRARGEDQGWIDVWVPLDRYARQEVTLRLRTEHGADPDFDWSGWANPLIVTHHTSRPHPGEPHKW
ncbi:MAG TPA: hypothetical protein VFN74_07390, partial [Chloroflexota bacterium]|nr:hypothetical protein [Chloroflexota bacterium]